MRPGRFVTVLFFVGLLGMPASLIGQRPTFEARVGLAWHGVSTCHYLSRNRGIALGLEARARGAWIASVALDLMGDLSYGCFDVGIPPIDYGGTLVDVRGDSGSGLLRARVALGGSRQILGVRSALTAGAGLSPTITDYDRGGRGFSWQPWYGGTLTLRVPGTDIGLQLELGRHRLTQRYYLADTNTVIAEKHDWEHLVRTGLSFPF